MPGNEVGDRVHNFFAQDNLSQSQHHSQAADGNWPLLNNNPWVGIHRQIDVESSKPKNYDTQQSDLERGPGSHSLQVSHDLNSTHPTLRPELAKNQSHNQHPNLNGYMYGRQVFHSRPNETNCLGMDTESDQNNLMARGLSIYGPSQGSGPEHPTTSVRLDSSESPVSFDLFGGQQQMGGQHPGMMQSLPQQHSEFSDMQLMQKLVMIRRVQELQRQKEIWQLDARQQNSVNQVPSFARQSSSNHSHALINGTPISDASSYPWATEVTAGNTNWLQRASQAMQGSSSGLLLSPEQGQVSHSVGLVHQQVDQSLYGVPISSLRGSANQCPHIAMDKPLQQMTPYCNSFQVKQYTVPPPEQVSMQDGTLTSRQGFQDKNLFRHNSGQGLNSGMNMENLQQRNPLRRNVPVQEFQGRQEIGGPSEIVKDKTAQASSSQNSVVLDPTEEKILFGSDDDSIWDVFGKSSDMSGGASNLVDGAGFINGFPSIQSGSWSALMQSAVAETSSSDLGLQEEWIGFSFQNPDLPTGNNQPSTYNDTGKCQTSLDDSNLQITLAFSIRSDLPSDDANLKNNDHSAQGFQQFEQNISQEHGEGLYDNSSQRPIHQSPAGGSNWLNRGNQTYRNDSHSVDADTNGKSSSSYWTPQQSGFSQPSNKPNNWGATESVTPCGDVSFDIHENEKSMHKFQKNDQKRVMHEKLSNYDGVGKVSSIPHSAVELEQLRSTVGSPQVSREGSGLSNAAAVANSSNTRASEEASRFLPNSYHLNNWKLVNSSVKSKGSDRLGKLQNPVNKGSQLVESSLNSSKKEEVKMHEIDTFNKKENLNDSYHSNLPHHTSAIGLKENVLSDASDSQTQAGGKQKSSNQVGRKTSVSRKFQYHPMGNLDEDVEPSYRVRQATHSQTMPLHNSQGSKSQEQGFFGQSKLFDHIPKSSIEMGKGQWADREGGAKGLDEVPHRGILPGYRPSMPAPFDRSVGMMASNKASHSSQNMLELLHKVDQSKEHGMGMHFSSSEHNLLSETTEAENSDGSGGRFQRSQSSASQGFGLQLAPPSQRLSVSNHVSRCPSTVNSPTSNKATSDRGDKGHIGLSSTTLGQSLPSSYERSQGEFKNSRNVFPGQTSHEASLHRTQENSSAFNSGFPYSRSQLQNHLIAGAREQGSMSQSIDVPFDKHARPPKQADVSFITLTGQSAEASFPNTACSVPYDNINSYANISRPTAADCSHERAPAEKISPGEVVSISQSFTANGMSQQGAFPRILPTIWTNVPAQQQFLVAQARQVQPKLLQSHQSDIVESTSSALRNLENQDAKIRGNIPSDLGSGSVHSQGFVSGEEQLTVENPCQQVSSGNMDLVQKMNESRRKESIIQHLSDVSPSNPASTQREIEAFGRSLKPNNFFQQNYSLLNQMRAIKNVETDPSNRSLKRSKGPNNILLGEQVASKLEQPNESDGMVEEASVSRSSVPSGDPKMLSFSGRDDYLERNASSSQLGNVPSQDMLAFNQNESQSYSHGNSTASVRIEQPKITPQMAPSWFNQYGTLKNGQMLQIYDAQKADTVKIVEQPFMLGKSSGSLHTLNSMQHVNAAADTNQNGTWQSSISVSQAVEHFSPPQSLPPEKVGQTFVVLRPKKRKNATSELQSWHKEVLQGSQNLQTISMAETDWSKATNRLSEKVEDDASTVEYRLPMPRARRRLILTTQLMQQLFRAPPAVILSADASSNYEPLAYFVARLALGDACSLVSCLKNYSEAPPDGANFQADKCKISNGIDDHHLSRVMEDFMGRARKLENDLLRLEKRSSVLDLRVEGQDLEKISVINRFAKFHGRGQADGAETSSSTNASIAQKPFPQKCVTAVPLPRNLPDRVQCLSL